MFINYDVDCRYIFLEQIGKQFLVMVKVMKLTYNYISIMYSIMYMYSFENVGNRE